MGRLRPGFLARLFCLAPHARVRHLGESSSESPKTSQRAPGKASVRQARAPCDAAADSPLAAYLGRHPPKPFAASSSNAASSSSTGSSNRSAGLVAAWVTHCDAGYDADSDIAGEGAAGRSGRRFAPATRHPAAAAPNHCSAEPKAPAAELQAKVATTPADLRPSPFSSLPPSASCGSLAALAATTGQGKRSYSRQQSRQSHDGSVLTAPDGVSSATASSISLAHLLALGASGSSGGKRRLRHLGSTQVVVSLPGSPRAGPAPGKADGLQTVEQAAGAPQPAGPAARTLQRRLTDMHSGHFISLHKLQEQCGAPEGEGGGWLKCLKACKSTGRGRVGCQFSQPPVPYCAEPPIDLLGLLARRVLDGRAASLLQRLHSESQVAELRAAEAAATPEDVSVPATPSPRAALLDVGDLPRLPPIRTHVGRRRLSGAARADAEQPFSA